MKTMFRTAFLSVAAMGSLWSAPAFSASHQWRFNEVFSTADGSVQFIEMKECCGFTAENSLNNKWIQAVGAATRYTFRRNLQGNTANKHLLLATQAFADMPGAPAPDFIIPEGFLPIDGDILEYWSYDDARWSYGAVPTDGLSSLLQDGTTETNSPTNYAGTTGTVDASQVPTVPLTWGRVKSGVVPLP